MIFGEKFYGYLRKLRPWQASLFALVLAERLRPNYLFFCSIANDHQKAQLFNDVIDKLWVYHTDKFNHIELKPLVKMLNKCMPKDIDNLGASFASDAVSVLLCSVNALIERNGNEAVIASDIAENTVVKFLEANSEDTANDDADADPEGKDDDLYDNEVMQNEMDFQISLMEDLRKDDRSLIAPKAYRDAIRKEGISNIGISI